MPASRARAYHPAITLWATLLKWYALPVTPSAADRHPVSALLLADVAREPAPTGRKRTLDVAETIHPHSNVQATVSTVVAGPARPTEANHALQWTSTGPFMSTDRALTRQEKLQEARRLLLASGEITLNIEGLKAQMRAKLAAQLQMPKQAEDTQYMTTNIEAMPQALMLNWLLAMGWTRMDGSPDHQPALETNSNKILGQLYSLSKTGVSINASKLHTPRSSPAATTMMTAIAPATVTMYKRPDKSEWVSIVTNLATLNEVRSPCLHTCRIHVALAPSVHYSRAGMGHASLSGTTAPGLSHLFSRLAMRCDYE
mgnify:CR=1 FL=1